jgi:hypothetical protein
VCSSQFPILWKLGLHYWERSRCRHPARHRQCGALGPLRAVLLRRGGRREEPRSGMRGESQAPQRRSGGQNQHHRRRHGEQHHVVVFTNITLHTAVEMDEFCHHHDPPISFMPPCELGTTVSLRSTSCRRMIPAIATTTAMATGLVDLLELYKALQLEQNVERYSDTFANLALPLV